MTSFLALLAAVSALGLALYSQVLSHLRREHPASWDALGRPSLAPQSLVRDRVAMQRFLWAREFASLADAGLTRKCQVFRWFLVIYVFCFPMAVLVTSQ